MEIDGDGVTIERFTATSKYVAIEYGVSAAALTGPGIVTIESAGESEIWTERHRHNVTAPETNLVELTGFYVGDRLPSENRMVVVPASSFFGSNSTRFPRTSRRCVLTEYGVQAFGISRNGNR